VQIEGLTAAYGADVVLHDVSLEVHPGEVVALLGPSGCGKTTLLRCIAGLETPTGGRILIGDQDVTGGRGVPPQKRRVGMVFQDGALFPHRNVGYNVGYGVARSARRDDRRAAALHLVGLDNKADRMPGSLSGGEQQRVALARALAPEPAVMLLDEPFSSLDAGLRWQLRSDVRRLLKDVAVTTILVTHDQDEALTFGDRVAVMRAGVLEQFGSPAELYGSPASAWVAGFVGEANFLHADLGAGSAVTAIGVVPVSGGVGRGTVLCRPEQLELDPGGEATVSEVSYFGRGTRYEVSVDGIGAIVVRSAGPPIHAAGDAVRIRFVGLSAHAWSAG